VVYKVRQLGRLPTLSSHDYEVAPRSDEFFQEEGLDGNLIIDLGDEFDVYCNIERVVEEVIDDDDDLKLLNSSKIPVHQEEDYNSELLFEDSDDDLGWFQQAVGALAPVVLSPAHRALPLALDDVGWRARDRPTAWPKWAVAPALGPGWALPAATGAGG
jgi:hypothetical protein